MYKEKIQKQKYNSLKYHRKERVTQCTMVRDCHQAASKRRKNDKTLNCTRIRRRRNPGRKELLYSKKEDVSILSESITDVVHVGDKIWMFNILFPMSEEELV